MTAAKRRRLDQDAGPVVRLYALTQGRTRPRGAAFDLIDVVAATGAPPADRPWLDPEHGRVLDLCRQPVAVADVASDIDLPLAVVRVLLDDLCQQGLVTVLRVAPGAQTPDLNVMRDVLDGLKAL